MRRVVRYKKRTSQQTKVKVNPAKKLGHQYQDFIKEMEENPVQQVVEMDTVEGTKGGKVLQTFFWRKEKLMLAFLLEKKEMTFKDQKKTEKDLKLCPSFQ